MSSLCNAISRPNMNDCPIWLTSIQSDTNFFGSRKRLEKPEGRSHFGTQEPTGLVSFRCAMIPQFSSSRSRKLDRLEIPHLCGLFANLCSHVLTVPLGWIFSHLGHERVASASTPGHSRLHAAKRRESRLESRLEASPSA